MKNHRSEATRRRPDRGVIRNLMNATEPNPGMCDPSHNRVPIQESVCDEAACHRPEKWGRDSPGLTIETVGRDK